VLDEISGEGNDIPVFRWDDQPSVVGDLDDAIESVAPEDATAIGIGARRIGAKLGRARGRVLDFPGTGRASCCAGSPWPRGWTESARNEFFAGRSAAEPATPTKTTSVLHPIGDGYVRDVLTDLDTSIRYGLGGLLDCTGIHVDQGEVAAV
jgi:hypothetical protein